MIGFSIADGALGTLLLARGFTPPFEALNAAQPDVIRSAHRDYADAGAQVLLTNTFAANPIRWKSVSGRDDFETVNRAAVELARAAAGGKVFVAGSIGPSGLAREELEALKPGALVENFAAQARVLSECGVDALWLETFTNLRELEAAVEGCRQIPSPLIRPNGHLLPQGEGENPADKEGITLIATVSPRFDGSLADGTALADWIAFLNASAASVIGIGCADAPEKLFPIVEKLFALATKPVALKLNAGLPVFKDGRAFYASTPESYASQLLPLLREPHLRLIGGCCGTTPEFIRRLAAMLKASTASNEKK